MPASTLVGMDVTDATFQTEVIDPLIEKFKVGSRKKNKFMFCGVEYDQCSRTKECDVSQFEYIKEMHRPMKETKGKNLSEKHSCKKLVGLLYTLLVFV